MLANLAFTNSIPFERIQLAFDSASDALIRLDERLYRNPIAEAFSIRSHFREACAALWREGRFVQIEDLVLHDAAMDVRAPTFELTRAHTVLLARRRIFGKEPGWALTHSGLVELRGKTRSKKTNNSRSAKENRPDDEEEVGDLDDEDRDLEDLREFGEVDSLISRSRRNISELEDLVSSYDGESVGIVYDQDWNEKARLADWLEVVKATRPIPPLIAAGIAFYAWQAIEPLQRKDWLGMLLVSEFLRERGKTRHHLTALHAGLRKSGFNRHQNEDTASRLIRFANAVEAIANTDLKEVDRLSVNRELLLKKCEKHRTNSKLPKLVELCLKMPMVSIPLVAKELGISQQAASLLIAEISSNLREMTGRGRYRAWALV